MRTPERNTIVLYCLPKEKQLVREDIRKWYEMEGSIPFNVPLGDLRRHLRGIQPLDAAINICAVYYGIQNHTGDFEGVRFVGLEKFLIGF